MAFADKLAQIIFRGQDETGAAFASVQGRMRDLRSVVSQLAPSIATALSVGGVIAFAKSAIDAGDAMNDMAQKTGLSVESLSKWKFVAEQSNTSLEGMVPGLKGLAQNMDAAARGSKESSDAFTRLGVPVKDSAGNLRAMDAVMLDLADKFAKMPDGAQKTALAVRIFGKAGQEMIPILNQGQAGIAELMAAGERMGVVMSSEAAAAADEFNDSLGLIQSSVQALSTQLVNQSAKAISQVAKAMADAAREGGIFAAVVRGYGEAWKVLLFGSDPAQIDQQREFIEDTEKRLAAASSRLNAAMRDAQRFPGAVTQEVMNRLRTEVAGLELTARAARQSLELMEAKKAIQAPAVPVTPTGDLDAAARERELRLKAREELSKQIEESRAQQQLAAFETLAAQQELNEKRIADEQAALTVLRDLIEDSRQQQLQQIAETLAEADRLETQRIDQRNRAMANLIDSLRTEQEVIEQDFGRKQSLLRDWLTEQERELAISRANGALDEEIYQQKLINIQAIYHDKSKRLDNQRTEDLRRAKAAQAGIAIAYDKLTLNSAQFFFSQIGALMQTKSKALFEVGRAGAISGAIVSAHKAAADAQAALAGIPIVGPALGRAAAFAAYALGIAQADAIRRTEFGAGSAATGVFAANPSTGLPASPTGPGFVEPPPSPIQQQQPLQRQQVNITLLSDTGLVSVGWIRDSLIPALREALGDGVVLNVR